MVYSSKRLHVTQKLTKCRIKNATFFGGKPVQSVFQGCRLSEGYKVRDRQQKTHSKIRRTKQNVQGHETIIAAKSESSDWDVACGMLKGKEDGNVCRVGAITAGPKEPS